MSLTRRSFVKLSAAASAGLVIGIDLTAAEATAAGAAAFTPSAWLRIEPAGRIVFLLDKAEMGQGVYTSLAVLVAEELEVEPALLAIEFAPADRRYDNSALSMQITGGSTSMATSYQPLRKAAAAARIALVRAGAKALGVTESECIAQDGAVHHRKSGRKLSYAALAAGAAQVELPSDPPLKPDSALRYIGKSQPRLDNALKVTGRAGFGIDVDLPGLLSAVIVRCPVLGGKLASFDEAKLAGLPGIVKAVPISTGLAIVAERHYQAKKAAEHLVAQNGVTWNEGPLAGLDTDEIFADYLRRARERTAKLKDSDETRGLLNDQTKTVSAEYRIPYVAHAPMEPVNCTAHVRDDLCEVWAPTQGPGLAQQVAAEISGLPLDKVKIHSTFIGGGFGRRLYQDYVAEAVELSRALKRPVKIIWTREDDLRHDFYRPASVHALSASLGDDGRPRLWTQCIVGQSILAQTAPSWIRAMLPTWVPQSVKRLASRTVESLLPALGKDDTSVEGAHDAPYDLGLAVVDYVAVEPGVPVGFWRSVGHSYTGFVVESFIDELAHASGKDPYQYRRDLLRNKPRERAVLDLVAEKSGWDKPLPPGIFRGIATHTSFGSRAAQVAEVEIVSGRIKVHRIVCALDCGRVIDPGTVEAQMQGGVIFGLSAALLSEITIKHGRVQQTNFHEYEVARLPDAPKIEVHLVPSTAAPTGVGEPGVPPVAPAVANAVFMATKQRLRQLPLRLQSS